MTTGSAETANRAWIAAEFSKGIDAEQSLIEESKARSDSPPDPALRVLYNEIVRADERHKGIVETIATRYGHTPTRGMTGGIAGTFDKIKGKVGEMGATPLQLVGYDLAAKANAIHWYTAWVAAFEAIGDTESAQELSAVLTEEKSHRDALQSGLERLVTAGAQTTPSASAAS